jgi:RNA polymerase sigma-70 factor (ECF subfamily)
METPDTTRTFERLYDEYVDAIFAYLARRLGDRERAKELTHEVFVRLWKQLAEQKPITHERAFLYTIAKRLFINEIRAPERTYSLDVLTEQGFDAPEAGLGADMITEASLLWQYIATLPPATAELLRLRYQDGLPVQDIAQIFAVSETAISMRLNRAIEKLQQLYRPNESTTP